MPAPYLIATNRTAYILNKTGNTLGFPLYPATFRYALFSLWACLGQDVNASHRNLTWECSSNFFSIFITSTNITVRFTTGVSSFWFNGIYNHSFAGPITNIQVSVDGAGGIVQVYVNDTPLTLTSGGLTGTAPGPFIMTEFWTTWELGGGSWSTTTGPGVGDIYMAAPSLFFDLSVVANRRRFQNADLSPVDLGVDGSWPLGYRPPIYLTARGEDAANFAVNNGSGGPLDLHAGYIPTMLPPDTCSVPWPPPGVIATLTDAELVFEPTPGFVDFAAEANRRLFISSAGTPAWMERNGALPFGGPPIVYLTTFGPPLDFVANNGTGGGFTPTGPINPAGGPGCTPYFVTEAAGPAYDPQWRLTVSDDGGRTWSTLVKPRSIGKLGEYLSRLRWLKMGQSRERMIRLECTDPIRRNIVGIYIDAGQGMT
jgi:hypothetical protein